MLTKYHTSIKETPMWNWVKLFEDEDLKHLKKSIWYNPLTWLPAGKKVYDVYQMLSDQVIDAFNIPDDYKEILNNKIQIELLYIKMMETGDKTIKLFIRILELKNESLKGKNTKVDLYGAVLDLQDQLPYQVNIKTLMVYDYHFHSQRIAKRIEAQNRIAARQNRNGR